MTDSLLEALRAGLDDAAVMESEAQDDEETAYFNGKVAAHQEAITLAERHVVDYERLERAYKQACMNLATIRPEGHDLSLGEIADLYYNALLAGWGGILGWTGE